MQKRILAFLYDEDRKYNGDFIVDSIGKVAEFYGIENKILCITFGNSSNNKTAITKLKSKLSPSLPEIFHIKCACHIYNLIVKMVLSFLNFILKKSVLLLVLFKEIIKEKELENLKLNVKKMNLHRYWWLRKLILDEILRMIF